MTTVEISNYNSINSLEELILNMGTTQDGRTLSSVGEVGEFKHRLKLFKEYLKRELSEFSDEELIKFHKNFHKFKKIYEWQGASYLLTAIGFELHVKNKL